MPRWVPGGVGAYVLRHLWLKDSGQGVTGRQGYRGEEEYGVQGLQFSFDGTGGFLDLAGVVTARCGLVEAGGANGELSVGQRERDREEDDDKARLDVLPSLSSE